MILNIDQLVFDLDYEGLFIHISNIVNRSEESKIVEFNKQEFDIATSLLIIDLSTESAITNSAKFRMNLINIIMQI
jgi:hypothetical protein